MAVTRRFLIVGWKVKTGGGEVILRNYLSFLNDNPDDCSYVALVHDKALYEPVACPRVRLVQPGRLLQTNLAAPWMYHVVLPRLLKVWRIDGIFVFGGIPIPTSVPQLYLFQWAYAVYPHSPAWRRMDLLSLINRRIRVWAFRRHIQYPAMVIAQTETMKRRLSATCGVSRISTVPVAVSPQHSAQRERCPFDRPAGRMVFLCLTHYYPHKNLEMLLPVAAEIKKRSLAYTIVTTIEAEDHKRAAKLLTRLHDQGLTDIVTNIGRVRHADLAATLFPVRCHDSTHTSRELQRYIHRSHVSRKDNPHFGFGLCAGRVRRGCVLFRSAESAVDCGGDGLRFSEGRDQGAKASGGKKTALAVVD